MQTPEQVYQFLTNDSDNAQNKLALELRNSRDIKVWYTLVNGLALYLEANPEQNPIQIAGKLIYKSIKYEMMAFQENNSSLLAQIHEFLAHIFAMQVFQKTWLNYFQIVDQLMLNNQMDCKCVFGSGDFIKDMNGQQIIFNKNEYIFDSHIYVHFVDQKIQNM